MTSNSERAQSALHALDPGTNRDTWMRIAMAAKDAGLTLDDFTEWSRPAPNFGSECECATLWHSIKNGPVTAGTLYRLAQSMGWKDPGTGRVNGHSTHGKAFARPTADHKSAQRQRAVIAPLEVWNRCEPATADHAYIIAKRGRPDGLRVVPAGDNLEIAGRPVAGWLVVPVLSVAGELRTLQFIPSPGEGRKLNLQGASFADGFFATGNLADSPCAYIVEGIGQAWACHTATVHCHGVLWCWTYGNGSESLAKPPYPVTLDSGARPGAGIESRSYRKSGACRMGRDAGGQTREL